MKYSENSMLASEFNSLGRLAFRVFFKQVSSPYGYNYNIYSTQVIHGEISGVRG